MKLKEQLSGRRKAVLRRWRSMIADTYPPEAGGLLREERDRFSNPLGRFINRGTELIYDELLGGMNREIIRDALDPIIRIRAVQDFDPATAAGFMFLLKKAVREELTGDIGQEYPDFESKVDEAALMAFEIYMRCREKLYEIRANEIRNRSAVLLKRMNTIDAETSK